MADGQRRAVESADVNPYIREVLGDDFSAEARRNILAAVPELLGDTAAVCKGSYIHPLVLESYDRGVLPLRGTTSSRAFELSVLKFLEAARDSTG